ncbi:hypothetical protein ABZT49_23395 [Methylobacterium sp. EM32]|uniref:hypothetical protein n=1 Tax=Methylobacterium sp. EM32 TaxID=3163481 RepID=UPI0033B3A9B4
MATAPGIAAATPSARAAGRPACAASSTARVAAAPAFRPVLRLGAMVLSSKPRPDDAATLVNLD